MLFTRVVAAHAQSARQVNPSASIEVVRAARQAEIRHMIRYFDPLAGHTLDHGVNQAVRPAGPIICLTNNNLLGAKAFRTAAEFRKRLILVRSETESETCLTGSTACPKCPVTPRCRTVRARLTADADFMARHMFGELDRDQGGSCWRD